MWGKFIEAAHLWCKTYKEASRKASEVQDRNNNEHFFLLCSPVLKWHAKWLLQLREHKKTRAVKHLAAEANELPLIRQRELLFCVTVINALYMSLAVPIKLWNLKVQIITVNFSEAVHLFLKNYSSLVFLKENKAT